MSERERWIVYPLLFLALGAALRDKLVDMTTSKRIICQELMVVDGDSVGLRTPRRLAHIGRIEGAANGAGSSGFLYVDGPVEVNGPLVARQIAMRGLPYASGILNILPNELWRALQQSAQGWQRKQQAEPAEKTSPPAPVPPTDATTPEKSADEPSD